MKYALFVAEKPNIESVDKRTDWGNFLGYVVQTLTQTKGNQMLNEGTVWMSLDGGLHDLSILVQRAKDLHISSRTLFFDQEPLWIFDKP